MVFGSDRVPLLHHWIWTSLRSQRSIIMVMAAIRPEDHQARCGGFLVPGPFDRLVPSWERDRHGQGDGEHVLELVLQAEASLVCCSTDLATFVKCFQRQLVWGSQIHSSSQNQLMIVRSPKNCEYDSSGKCAVRTKTMTYMNHSQLVSRLKRDVQQMKLFYNCLTSKCLRNKS